MGKMSTAGVSLKHGDEQGDLMRKIMCPESATAAKLTNRFQAIMVKGREEIDMA